MTPEQLVEAIVQQMMKEAGPAPNAYLIAAGTSFTRTLARDIVASEVPYLEVENGKAIMCLKCGLVSHNPNDVERRYCGACKEFHA